MSLNQAKYVQSWMNNACNLIKNLLYRSLADQPVFAQKSLARVSFQDYYEKVSLILNNTKIYSLSLQLNNITSTTTTTT